MEKATVILRNHCVNVCVCVCLRQGEREGGERGERERECVYGESKIFVHKCQLSKNCFLVCHCHHRNLKDRNLKPILMAKTIFLIIFFQAPTIEQIVKKIMTKHLGTFKTDDQIFAEIFGLKQLKPVPNQTNLTEQVPML
jgi:hypothetical protein